MVKNITSITVLLLLPIYLFADNSITKSDLYNYLNIINHRIKINLMNIGNINTIGYKKIIFEYDSTKLEDNNYYKKNEKIDFSQGSLLQTKTNLNISIIGDGFYIFEGEHGKYLNRSGIFKLSEERFLVNNNGHKLYPEIQIPEDVNENEIFVKENGEVWIGKNKSIVLAKRIQIAKVKNMGLLIRKDNDYFYQGSNIKIVYPDPNEAGELLQGFLELSNVNLKTEEMFLKVNIRSYIKIYNAILKINPSFQMPKDHIFNPKDFKDIEEYP